MATVTLFKVHCAHCGEITPQLDNTCTWLCQVCSGHNSLSTLHAGEWSAEELAAYWQMKYRATLAEKRVVLASNKPYPADVVSAQPANHDQGQDIVVNGRMLRFGLDSELNTEVRVYEVAQRQPDSQGDILLAEAIPGGMMVSKAPPLPMNEGFATDFTALREEIARELMDPNTLGTL